MQFGGGPIGLAHDVVDRRRQELVSEHDRAPLDEHVADVACAGRVHEARDRVAQQRMEVRLGQVQHHQIGPPPGCDAADLVLEPEGAGATQRRELEHLSGGERKRVSIGVELLTRPPLFTMTTWPRYTRAVAMFGIPRVFCQRRCEALMSPLPPGDRENTRLVPS